MTDLIKEYLIVAIMVAVYLIIAMLKPLFGEKTKFIPLFAGILGVLLNWWMNGTFDFNVFLTGLASGWSATGLDQVIKQTSGYYDLEEDAHDTNL